MAARSLSAPLTFESAVSAAGAEVDGDDCWFCVGAAEAADLLWPDPQAASSRTAARARIDRIDVPPQKPAGLRQSCPRAPSSRPQLAIKPPGAAGGPGAP